MLELKHCPTVSFLERTVHAQVDTVDPFLKNSVAYRIGDLHGANTFITLLHPVKRWSVYIHNCASKTGYTTEKSEHLLIMLVLAEECRPFRTKVITSSDW